ncbi:MAG: aspartate kinase [Clostridiales Family XIII bacterium]|jgi:aspartate kinase|nr:aspartate kinase [Clostridiales Family XIII bacterium]
MGIKVAKFGGTSVADANQIRKTGEIIRSDGDRRIVIVSAPGKRFDADNKITDLLYLLKTHMEQNAPYEQVLQIIRDRFLETERELGVRAGVAEEFRVIEARLVEGASADYIASRGEYISAKIVAAYLGFDFVDAAGLVRFGAKGKFLREETKEALGATLSACERAVLPGFYGTRPDGEIKTFSRGGSDITGALAAGAVGADVYENWTDVSGFLMADPRIVANPKAIDVISYKELRELSYMGASVLHENAIYPVRLAGIPINIRNTNRPEDKGTMIVADDIAEEQGRGQRIITGIAGNRDFTVIAIYKNMMSAEVGFIRRVLGILEDYDVSVEHIPSGVDTVSVVIADRYLNGKLDDIIDDIERKTQADSVEVFENMSLIATVGSGMMSRKGVAASLFAALADAGVNIRMIDQGSSEMNIIVGVENEDFETAIKAIYNVFVPTG